MSNQPKQPEDRGEALIAILNNPADLAILRNQGWYRIPVRTTPRRWPPKLLAFYQTKIFGDEAYAVRYYGLVREIREASRAELFPHEAQNAKSGKRYYQIMLDNLNVLPRPIVSRRWRRIVFIPTTISKLWLAEEINDLFDDSPLENRLWAKLKVLQVEAERQWRVEVNRKQYYLDFALFCRWGRVDVETDGDSWHLNRVSADRDSRRDADLQTNGWHVLRFTTGHVHDKMESYCLPVIRNMVKHLGGFGVSESYPPIDINNIVMCEASEDYRID